MVFILPLWCLITTFWSADKIVSVERSLYYIFISFLGTIIGYLWYQKKQNLYVFLPANILVIIISLTSLLFNIPNDNWSFIGVYAFKGFAGHPNTLGALIVFTFLPLIYSFATDSDMQINNSLRIWRIFRNYKNLFVIILVAMNILILLFTFSRASYLSVFIFFILVALFSRKLIFLLSIIIIPILFLGWFRIYSNFIDTSFEQVISKGQSNIYSTREKLFSDSYYAAFNGGVLGLGFGVSDPSIKNPIYTNQGKKIREKGNSFLALVEETGLVGLVIFFITVTYLIFYNKQRKINLEIKLLISLALSFLIHSQFEAWLVGVASLSLFSFYVILGCCITSIKGIQS